MKKEKDNSIYIEGNIISSWTDLNQKLDFILDFDSFKDIDCVINGKTITLDKEKLQDFLLQFVKENDDD